MSFVLAWVIFLRGPARLFEGFHLGRTALFELWLWRAVACPGKSLRTAKRASRGQVFLGLSSAQARRAPYQVSALGRRPARPDS